MPVQDLPEMAREQRLLRDLVAVVRRCDGPLPQPVLDAVLTGRCAVRPLLRTPPQARAVSRVRPLSPRPS